MIRASLIVLVFFVLIFVIMFLALFYNGNGVAGGIIFILVMGMVALVILLSRMTFEKTLKPSPFNSEDAYRIIDDSLSTHGISRY